MLSVNRIVALLTPVFSAAAAAGSAWLIKHFPGLPTPSQGQILGVELSAATAALGAALSWLKGHQQWEKQLAEQFPEVLQIASEIKKLDPHLAGEVETIVKAEIEKAFAKLGQSTVASPAPPAA